MGVHALRTAPSVLCVHFSMPDRPAVRAGRMKTVYGFPLPDDPRGKGIHMATKYYIENENGTILSEDGTRKFIVLEGQKLHDYLQTEEGKQKRFFVYEDNGEVIGIEEMPNTTKGETKEERRVRYQRKVKAEKKPNEISLDDLVEIEGGDLILLHEIVPDESEDTEGKAVLQVSLEELRVARRCLTDEENRLLDLVFTDTHTRTAEEVGKLLGRTQQSVDEKVKRILGYLYIELKRRRRW